MPAGVAGAWESSVVTLESILRSTAAQLRLIVRTPRLAFLASMITGAFLLSLSIGILYAGQIMVSGWQLWLWLLCALITIAILAPHSLPKIKMSRRQRLILLGVIAFALLARAAAVISLPTTLHVDEAGTANLTMTHVPAPDGSTLYPFGYGYNWQPALYHYIQRLSVSLLGGNTLALRTPSILAGTLAVLATYELITALSDRETGLIGASILAASHYHIHWSALAMNNVWDTIWVPAILGGYAWAWERGERWGLVICGTALGLSQYFYAGSKLGVVLLLILIMVLFRREADVDRLVRNVGTVVVLTAVIAAPIAIFAILNPGGYLERISQVFFWVAPTSSVEQGPWLSFLGEILSQAVRSLSGFTSLPDQTGFYGGNVPLTIGISAPLLAGGVLWAIYKRAVIPLAWLALTAFLGGFFLAATPSSSHYVVALPAIAWILAIVLQSVRKLHHPFLAYVLLAVVVSTDLIYYFGVYLPGGASPHLDVPFPTLQP